jgi:hypothetical protein
MRQNWVMAKDSAGATKTWALAQAERCAVGGQTRIGEFLSAGPLTLAEGTCLVKAATLAAQVDGR